MDVTSSPPSSVSDPTFSPRSLYGVCYGMAPSRSGPRQIASKNSVSNQHHRSLVRAPAASISRTRVDIAQYGVVRFPKLAGAIRHTCVPHGDRNSLLQGCAGTGVVRGGGDFLSSADSGGWSEAVGLARSIVWPTAGVLVSRPQATCRTLHDGHVLSIGV